MRDGLFIFDNVVHMYDNKPDNLNPSGVATARNLIGMGELFSNAKYPANDHFFDVELSVEEAGRILFEESDTDIAMAQTVPLFGWWKDGFSPARRQYALKEAYPDRVLFCGGVDPLYQGIDGALNEMTRQVEEMGAVSFKFYQAHHNSLSWRIDDRHMAYPMWEKALELGVNNVQFHKGVPFGTERMEHMHPTDIQQAAVDFPDLNFIIHHLGDPYIDESISVASRNNNVWLALSAWINIYPIMPREALKRLGKALMYVGPDRLLYGSEAFVWPNVQGYIELFMDLEMPEGLQEDYGFPPITRDDKRKILGENYAGLLGIDVGQTLKAIHGSDDRTL
ncbi:amidohydrolase family protein [Mycolicibacterium smegmatis]|uniref:Amidohydrolase 2 n=1 Tax=Mycolicibacterium smegmatis (strain MKD8) TaxID=1214915 RepID=A0A2U9PKB2_MYCSE|nr:amidohydrolase family protein [Mycolicibacterium smegmatis]AWT52184.1 amidohydrolase 2 [Mycolicibacterium smegmatis MKD8]